MFKVFCEKAQEPGQLDGRYEMCSGMFHALSPREHVREFWAGNRLGTCQLSNSADEEIFLSQFLVSAPDKQDSRKQSQSIYFF